MTEFEPFNTPEMLRLRTALQNARSITNRLAVEIAEAEDARMRELEAAHPEACYPCGRSHACRSCSPNRVAAGPGCMNCRQTGCDQTPCLACRDAVEAAKAS